jgi:tellurite resistance protein TerC
MSSPSVGTPLLWALFALFVVSMLALDLGVFHRRAHQVGIREAAAWSAFWVALAVIFNLGIWHYFGSRKALEFLTGYLIEESLSVDNLFVFLVIFSYFAVPSAYQHRVLFWGILGALVMRATLIATGAALVQRFHWMLYVFGAILVVTAIRLLLSGQEHLQPEKNPVVRTFRRLFPVTPGYEGSRMFVRRGGRAWATPLFIVLLVVETTDLVFALDSIPAIFAVTTDPFIIYTSNVFAILGLRSLYFLLAGAMAYFRFLRFGLAGVLAFIGAKLLAADIVEIPIGVSLAVVGALLAASVAASLLLPHREPARSAGHGSHEKSAHHDKPAPHGRPAHHDGPPHPGQGR